MADFFDIDSTFSLNAQGDLNVLEDRNAINQSIRSIIETSTGIRPGSGITSEGFGVNVDSFLFAPMNEFTAQSFSETILRQLTIFEPRIDIRNVNVDASVEEKRYEITVQYAIEGSLDVVTFRTIINQL